LDNINYEKTQFFQVETGLKDRSLIQQISLEWLFMASVVWALEVLTTTNSRHIEDVDGVWSRALSIFT